ncbi:MAG: hypothetical protein WC758_07530 [Candidatus Woesearchaeota archaeon]|jgi:hypothetical protein
MDIRKKENNGLNITIKVNKKNYNSIIKNIKNLGKEAEYDSNVNKLDYSILVNCQRLPYMNIKGWSSRVTGKDHRTSHVTFVDYDNILFKIIFDEISYITEKYNLPPWYVVSTFEEQDPDGNLYGNYLLYNFKKCTFKEVIDIQDKLSCDQAFKKIPLLYRFKCWCARLSEKSDGKKINRPKPKFKCIIGDTTKEHNQEISNSHLEAFNELYPETKDLIKYTNKDDGTIKDVTYVEYVTASG